MTRGVAAVMSKSLCILLGTWVCGILSGCGGSTVDGQMAVPAGPSAPARMALAAGDVLDVRFYYTPELNVTQTVRPDGKISLQLVGEVQVQGKTPDELRAELLQLYQPHLREPDVAVIVQSFYHRRVYVGGQVFKPGIITMPGQLTALEAIMEAGGFILPTAQVSSVVVLRQQDDVRCGYCINLKPALKGRPTDSFYLEPQDVVYVPQTPITEIGQWIDQHINAIIPKTGFVVLSTSGNTTVGYDLR